MLNNFKRMFIDQWLMWIYFENAHEPLIDKHTFEVVQHLLSKDVRKSPKKRIFPLSGLVQCAKCRENMIITSPDKRHFYYKCVNHQPGAGCESGRINAEKLKEAVEKAILYQISLLAEMQAFVFTDGSLLDPHSSSVIVVIIAIISRKKYGTSSPSAMCFFNIEKVS